MDEIIRSDVSYDHLVVVDLDDVLAPPVSVAAFEKALVWLDGDSSRGAVFANARPRYYDLWALRHYFWCRHDCWQRVQFAEKDKDTIELQIREVYGKMIRIARRTPPVPVMSAFGGIGIYRFGLTVQARYDGNDLRGRETCEHVAFNRLVRNAGGQLYIYPWLVVRAPVEHSYKARAFPKEMRRLLLIERLKMQLRWWLFLSRIRLRGQKAKSPDRSRMLNRSIAR
jgi:hypothetical protein